jgi:GDPmannose 4,6-dehydratase
MVSACRLGDIVDFTGRGGRPYFVKVDEAFYRPAEVDLLIGDPSKARRILGWEPKHTFRDLVAEMVQSDLANIKRAIKDGRAI